MKALHSISHSVLEWLEKVDLRHRFPSKFDREDSRLIIQSVIIGIVVWGPVYLLKLAIAYTYPIVLNWVGRMPSIWFILVPLWLGAIIVFLVAHYRGSKILYHDSDGEVHTLIDVEGDGLERAIALYHTSEPSFERTILGLSLIHISEPTRPS